MSFHFNNSLNQKMMFRKMFIEDSYTMTVGFYRRMSAGASVILVSLFSVFTLKSTQNYHLSLLERYRLYCKCKVNAPDFLTGLLMTMLTFRLNVCHNTRAVQSPHGNKTLIVSVAMPQNNYCCSFSKLWILNLTNLQLKGFAGKEVKV